MQAHRELIVEPVGLDLDSGNLPRPLNWAEMFGNAHPVEIEIGMGKAAFLTEQAKARPEVNFIGIEYARWYWRFASDRLRRAGCLNARTFRAEAVFFLSQMVADASVAALHVYFPDPWPKARHHKRRFIQEKNMPMICRVLAAGGRLSVVTDHLEYFEQIKEVVTASALTPADYLPPGSAGEGEMVGTNFERKYRREGRPFYAISATKSAP